MALKDVLATPPVRRAGFRSRVDVWRDGLDGEDRAAFDAAVKNPDWSTRALFEIVHAEGVEIALAGFTHWRRAARGSVS